MKKIKRKCYKTPRPCISDAYTIGGKLNESVFSSEKSIYYLVARKFPHDKFPNLYSNKNDNRIVFAGLQRIIDRLLCDPITHFELDNASKFFKSRKILNNGTLSNFDWQEDMWRSIVDDYNGFIPIKITGFPEGSTCYPQEPLVKVESLSNGYGILAAWFESSLIQVWAATCRLTASRHWLKYYQDLFTELHPEWDKNKINLMASIMLHDFGARAASTNQENEDIPYVQLYCFPGTDTFESAYQTFCNGAPAGTGTSIKALAHRNVQSFKAEKNCYKKMFETSDEYEILSMVADCYNFYNATENYILPLAIKSAKENKNITIVVRPDSGNALEQILWTLQLAVKNDLYTEDKNSGLKSMTTMRIIEGDSMTWKSMKDINDALLRHKFDPSGCLIYGVGGGTRNPFTRDDMSFKYALCAIDKYRKPVLKISETKGKRTLPEVKVIRSKKSLENGITIVDIDNTEKNAHVLYFNGLNYDGIYDNVCGPGFEENFVTIQNRILNQFDNMPLSAGLINDKIKEIIKNIETLYNY